MKRTAYCFLCVQQATIEKLLTGYSAYGDDSAYPRLVHEWLNDCDGYNEQNWLDYGERMRECEMGALIEFLCAKEMTSMLPDQFADFARQLQKMIAPLCCEPHDDERNLGYRALNKRLTKLGVPYQIERGKETYLIQSVDLKGGDSDYADNK